MAATYTVTGINLKGTPLGESDRLLTVLTRENGLIRVVAPGARKANSRLGGRSGLFVVNTLLIAKGRTLDKIIQAETLESYPGLGQDLRKLTASQYLAELVLFQALSDHPQDELFCLFNEHLTRLDDAPASLAIACLSHAIYHFLATAGIPPQVHECCISQRPLRLEPADATWYAGFSAVAGGVVRRDAVAESDPSEIGAGQRSPQTSSREPPIVRSEMPPSPDVAPHRLIGISAAPTVAETPTRYPTPRVAPSKGDRLMPLSKMELGILQCLAQPTLIRADGRLQLEGEPSLPELSHPIPSDVWLKIEHLLRVYAEYQFDRPIRSARLINTCFAPSS